MPTQVSVVIPVRDDAAGLPGAVSSVLGQVGVDVLEVFICVGPSEDESLQVAQSLAREHDVVTVLENPSGGISTGLNVGLAAARSDIVVRVDARCHLDADYAATAVATLTETGAANVGAVQVPIGHTTVQRAIAHAMAHALGSGGAPYRAGTERRMVDTAFLGVFQTEALRSVGGWDVGFARNEDAELNRRLIGEGHTVWLDPNMRVDYEPRPTLRSLARQYFDYGWWRSRTVSRHGVLQIRQLAAPLILSGVLSGVLLGAVVSPFFFLVPLGYAAALVVTAALSAATTLQPAERALVPVAWATMHLCWGAGFLLSLGAGWLRKPFGR